MIYSWVQGQAYGQILQIGDVATWSEIMSDLSRYPKNVFISMSFDQTNNNEGVTVSVFRANYGGLTVPRNPKFGMGEPGTNICVIGSYPEKSSVAIPWNNRPLVISTTGVTMQLGKGIPGGYDDVAKSGSPVFARSSKGMIARSTMSPDGIPGLYVVPRIDGSVASIPIDVNTSAPIGSEPSGSPTSFGKVPPVFSEDGTKVWFVSDEGSLFYQSISGTDPSKWTRGPKKALPNVDYGSAWDFANRDWPKTPPPPPPPTPKHIVAGKVSVSNADGGIGSRSFGSSPFISNARFFTYSDFVFMVDQSNSIWAISCGEASLPNDIGSPGDSKPFPVIARVLAGSNSKPPYAQSGIRYADQPKGFAGMFGFSCSDPELHYGARSCSDSASLAAASTQTKGGAYPYFPMTVGAATAGDYYSHLGWQFGLDGTWLYQGCDLPDMYKVCADSGKACECAGKGTGSKVQCQGGWLPQITSQCDNGVIDSAWKDYYKSLKSYGSPPSPEAPKRGSNWSTRFAPFYSTLDYTNKSTNQPLYGKKPYGTWVYNAIAIAKETTTKPPRATNAVQLRGSDLTWGAGNDGTIVETSGLPWVHQDGTIHDVYLVYLGPVTPINDNDPTIDSSLGYPGSCPGGYGSPSVLLSISLTDKVIAFDFMDALSGSPAMVKTDSTENLSLFEPTLPVSGKQKTLILAQQGGRNTGGVPNGRIDGARATGPTNTMMYIWCHEVKDSDYSWTIHAVPIAFKNVDGKGEQEGWPNAQIGKSYWSRSLPAPTTPQSSIDLEPSVLWHDNALYLIVLAQSCENPTGACLDDAKTTAINDMSGYLVCFTATDTTQPTQSQSQWADADWMIDLGSEGLGAELRAVDKANKYLYIVRQDARYVVVDLEKKAVMQQDNGTPAVFDLPPA